jgi:hypothetical protein
MILIRNNFLIKVKQMIKSFAFVLLFQFATVIASAQIDSIPIVEPDKETSYENYELLIIAIAGFLLLLVVYFFFKHSRRIK